MRPCPEHNPYCNVMSVSSAYREQPKARSGNRGEAMAGILLPEIIKFFQEYSSKEYHKTIVKGEEITERKWFFKQTRTECKNPNKLIPSTNIPRYGVQSVEMNRKSNLSCAHKDDVERFGYFDEKFKFEERLPKAYEIYFGKCLDDQCNHSPETPKREDFRMYLSSAESSTQEIDAWYRQPGSEFETFLVYLFHFVFERPYEESKTFGIIHILFYSGLASLIPNGKYYLDVIPIYGLPIQSSGGTLTKTSEKVIVGNSTRVIYKLGRTKYVKSQHGYMTLSDFLASKKQKSYKIV